MGREIKFRAWDGRQLVHDGDCWNGENRQNSVPSLVYPVLVTNKGIRWCKKLGPLTDGDIVRDLEGNEGYTNWEIDKIASRDIEIMQYTGLKDKNLKEIYEGDIFDSLEGRYLVRWFNGDESAPEVGSSMNYPYLAPAVGFGFERISGEWNHKDFKWCYYQERTEVIGNIYENPELLTHI